MISIEWNTVRLGVQMQELISMSGITASAALTRFARQVVRDCHNFTPPGARGARTSSAAKKRGMANIENDVRSRFTSVDEISFRELEVEKAIIRYTAGKDYNLKKAEEVFRRSKFTWVKHVISNPTVRLHKQAMKQRDKYVIPTGSESARDGVVKAIQGRLGFARSGWAPAMQALRIPVPPWVRRHSGPGYFRGIRDRNKPEIEFANMVPYVQGYRTREGIPIVEAAMKRREQFFQKELAVYYAAIGRGDGKKVVAKLQKDQWEALEP